MDMPTLPQVNGRQYLAQPIRSGLEPHRASHSSQRLRHRALLCSKNIQIFWNPIFGCRLLKAASGLCDRTAPSAVLPNEEIGSESKIIWPAYANNDLLLRKLETPTVFIVSYQCGEMALSYFVKTYLRIWMR